MKKMSGLISRQAAIDALEAKKDKSAKGDIGCFYNTIIQNTIDALMGLPSAQPERKKGHWAKISPANIYECSKCGKNVMTNDISEYNFCHGCGADMREERK